MYRNLGIDFKRVGKLILILDDFADKLASVFVRLPASRIGKDTVAVLSIRSIQPKFTRDLVNPRVTAASDSTA
jgi:hypothetical protein